jgi:hypothetical protein
VSTGLESWGTDRPHVFARDVQIDDTAYRRLDPEYYAWLRSKMQIAKMAADAGRIERAEFDDLRRRFNAVHEWAVGHFGETRLVDAVGNLDAREYQPPVAEPETPRRVQRNTDGVCSEALALVDTIRDHAISVGWTHESLYQTGGHTRFAVSHERGLVCYLKPGDQIGEVTTHSIEIVRPNNVRQRFYNPDVDQPWVRRIR